MNPRARILEFLAVVGLVVSLTTASVAVRGATPSEAETEANITRVTAGLLGGSQFAHHPLDDELASKFLDRYLGALDGERALFLRSDVAEFAAFRPTLARDTVRAGDTRVAYIIFDRYLERLEQRVAYVTETLRTATFDFTGDASYALDRKHAARPPDLASARELWWQRLRFDYLREKLDGKEPERIVRTLENRSKRLLRTMTQFGRDEVLEVYLSTLAQVYDPHSDYLGHKQMSEFAISMNLSLLGIGARLRSVDGQCEIVDLLPGGPAMRSGLLGPGDRIVAVAQEGEEPVDVVEMPLSEIVQLIRGPKGTVVILTVKSASAGEEAIGKTIRLVRDEIKLEEQRAKAKIVDLPTGSDSTLRLGVIDLPSFYASLGQERADGGSAPEDSGATTDVARLLGKMNAEGVRGVVLDLRRNGGGSLQEAIKLTGLFITEGPVVQTRGPRGDVEVGSDPDPTKLYEGPLVVLTSRFSASASEIVAGALQDYGRAIVVGDASTFGKGTVQSVVPLAPLMDRAGIGYGYDPGALKVTIRKFYLPGGSSTQLRGVVSDIVLPALSGVSKIEESALDNPLPWDLVPPADYRRDSTLEPYLDTLRDASKRRVSDAEEFAYLRDEIARLRDRLEAKTVSLNESARRQELDRFEARKKQYESAMEALDTESPITYEISVGDAARPGLPPPSTDDGETAAAAAVAPAVGASNPDSDPEAPSRHDPVLIEAQRILVDYATLLGRAAGRGAGPANATASREAQIH